MGALRNSVREFAFRLDRPGTRWLLSTLMPLYGMFAKDGVRKLQFDSGWIHTFDDYSVVEPAPRARDYFMSQAENQYLWGYLYTPRPGDTVLDIGAHLGWESIYYAGKVGPRGRVIAVEANPIMFGYLERSIKLNNYHNVTCLNFAIAGSAGNSLSKTTSTKVLAMLSPRRVAVACRSRE